MNIDKNEPKEDSGALPEKIASLEPGDLDANELEKVSGGRLGPSPLCATWATC